ncbi:hypothetical protein XA68_17223 [Ophiocordyceps unilateralis]|uniref:Lipocalin/cytosolic fatty-acid binding domain-containing protein n=1 Tax=Ophiocordyceps unilateralis TaxID=268505 RepID=A0A2A9P537_OPHUN|nr:hypothetical protein XA68_17223 [Ophiocordyceps unilateralis]
MRAQLIVSLSSLALASSAASPVAPASWDGKCFYPKASGSFELTSYLGRWYQVAGTKAPFTAGCKCIMADYALNKDETVQVNNSCETPKGDFRNIVGTATPSKLPYGSKGVFHVEFPGSKATDCPGPNYIVLDQKKDMAIVQTSNFTTLFLLSRRQKPETKVLDAWIRRAASLGVKSGQVERIDQSNCKYT